MRWRRSRRPDRRAACRRSSAIAWLVHRPGRRGRSSYNGLLVLRLHRAVGRSRGAGASTASPRARCGERRPGIAASRSEPGDAIHRRQLRAADPPGFRRPSCSAPASASTMPPPGDMRAGAASGRAARSVWEWLYAPVAAAVNFAAERLNHLQFLTIRRYLSLVFVALIAPAAGRWRYGTDPRPRHPGRRRCCWCCCWRRRSPASCAR